MFNLGSSSGMLGLAGRFDTKAGKDSLKHFQDAGAKLDKLSEATIGVFNKKNTTEAPLAKTEAATDSAAAEAKASEGNATETDKKDAEGATSVLDSAKNAISDAAAATKDAISSAYDKTKDSISSAIDATKDTVSSAYDSAVDVFDSGGMDEETFGELAAAAEASGNKKSWKDYLSDAYDTVASATSSLVDNFTGNFCSTSPFAACSSCPNRPKRGAGAGAGFDLLKEINGLITDLKNGFEDACLAIIGCPGITNALLEGDFEGLKNSVVAGGTKALVSTALDTGSSAFMGALYSVSPDAYNLVDSVASKVLSNSGANSFDRVCLMFDNLQTTGDQVLKAASYAKNGQFTAAFNSLSSRKSRGRRLHTGESGLLVARGYSSANRESTFVNPNVLTASLTKLYTNDPTALGESVSCTKLRTRGKYTSSKMSTLPGTTLGTETIKNGYAIDYLKTGTTPPKDTVVKRVRTRSNCLY